jgi:serine phosphatase RsbU (regulator of sigma subunit)
VDEAMSPDRAVFGVERLQQLVGKQRRTGAAANDILVEVERQIRNHVGSDLLEDDFTMIAVKLT